MDHIREEFVTPEVLKKYHPVAPIGQDKLFQPREFKCFVFLLLDIRFIICFFFMRNVFLHNHSLLYSSVWLFRYGREDLRGILRSVRRNDFTKQIMKQVETNSWLGKNYPHNRSPKASSIIQSTFIIDLVFKIRLLNHFYNMVIMKALFNRKGSPYIK